MSNLCLAILRVGLICGLAWSGVVAWAEENFTAVEGRPVAADFTLTDTDGRQHRLADYRGRVVVVNFWATWCPPCREEMPSLQRAYEILRKDDIAVLAIDIGEDADTVFTFTADYHVEFPLLLDIDSTVIDTWPIKGLPTTYIVDPEGRLAYRAIGGRAWDDEALLAQIRALRKPANP